MESGEHILKSENAPTLVSENLSNLSSEKSSLLALWEERRILYEQCMDLQLFYRDTEQADTWMAKQEVHNY
jgi:spectrin alpha